MCSSCLDHVLLLDLLLVHNNKQAHLDHKVVIISICIFRVFILPFKLFVSRHPEFVSFFRSIYWSTTQSFKHIIPKDSNYFRNIDDILFIYPQNIDLTKSTDKLNNTINFTYELENNNTLPFMDILQMNNNNKLELKVHHKSTNKNGHTHVLLYFSESFFFWRGVSESFSYVFLARRSLLLARKSCNVFVFTLSCVGNK